MQTNSDIKLPSQIGWLSNQKRGFIIIRGPIFNQDALENLFGALRAACGFNDNPTACKIFKDSNYQQTYKFFFEKSTYELHMTEDF